MPDQRVYEVCIELNKILRSNVFSFRAKFEAMIVRIKF